MKNLKKLLAVVLVVVLAFGIMATAAAANVTDYSDADDVQYTEAVDLFTALGFLAGMGDGTFDPQGLVTREQAAKIITYMLIGSTKADALKTSVSSFSDVAVDRWSAAYIEYCAAAGIINGNGDGTFNPAGNVTGAQFAKMLLCAIGYGVNDEYTGANWAMKTIADATSLGILSLDLDFTAPATREEVSQYGFNAYAYCNTVVYNSTTQAYQQAINIDGVSAKGSLATQQGVNNTTSTYTANGTTYYRWTKLGVELTGGYTKENVIGTSTMGLPLSMLTDSSNAFYIASLDTTVAYYYNGTVLPQVATNPAGSVTAGSVYYNTTEKAVVLDDGDGVPEAIASDASVLAAGVIVKFVNTDADSKAETVQVIKKAVAKLSGDPVVSNNMVTISAIPGLSSVATVKVPGYDSLADKDVVLWYQNTTTGTYYIDKATTVAGTVTGYVSATSATLGGATYRYTGLVTGATLTGLQTTVQDAAGLADTTLYLDDGGYICYAVQATSISQASNYAFVLSTATAGYSTQALIVNSDGTKSVVTLDPTSTLYGSSAAQNAFYKFAVASNGNYVLTAVAADPLGTGTVGTATVVDNAGTAGVDESKVVYQNAYLGSAAATKQITKGDAYYLTQTTGGAATAPTMANSSTVFVYRYSATATYAYTGIANAPTFIANEGAADAAGTVLENIYSLYLGGKAIFVYAGNTGTTAAVTTPFTPSTTTGDWVYIMTGNKTVNYVSSTLTTYTYQAFVNGTVSTVTVESSKDAATFNGATGLYQVTGYDANGYVTIATASGGATTPTTVHVAALAGDTLTVSGGVIADGTNTRVLNSSAKIWFVDITAAATTGVIVYEITGAQATALNSTGAVIDYVQSATDTSITNVYVYDTNA